LILAIDPGRRPGYVLLDETQLLARAHLPQRPSLPLVVAVALALDKLPPGVRYSRIVIEGQHGAIARERRNAILSLSVEAGWQLCRAVDAVYPFAVPHVIHPQAFSRTDRPGWRDALGCSAVNKSVVQARIERSLISAEQSLFACASAARLGDCLDAVAIGWGAWLSLPPAWIPPP